MFGLALIIGTYIPAINKLIATKLGATIIAILVAVMLLIAFTA
jgi:hypothetical protein